MDKKKLLEKLYQPYKNCQECPLSKLGRKNVVFGRGNPNAKIMFIGEAPGKDEDLEGKPFVGKSGKLLTKALKIVGIDENKIFITNIVKCRPPNNRQPEINEISICSKILLNKELDIIKPKIICTLGAIPTKFFLNKILNEKDIKMTKINGQLFEYNKDTKIIPIFHPAYILRNKNKAQEWLNSFNFLKKQQ